MTEHRVSSEPSMDEILASIRKIISEDTDPVAAAKPVMADEPPTAFAPPERDVDLDFELPSILRPNVQPASGDKSVQAPLLGRLADALRGGAASQTSIDPARSLEDDLADLLDEAPAAVKTGDDLAAAAPGSKIASDPKATTGIDKPQTKQLLANLDQSLAMLNEVSSIGASNPARRTATMESLTAPARGGDHGSRAARDEGSEGEPAKISVSPYTFPSLKRATANATPPQGGDAQAPKPTFISSASGPGAAASHVPPDGRAQTAVIALAEAAGPADPHTVATAMNALTAGVAAFREQQVKGRAVVTRENGADASSALVRSPGTAVASEASARLSAPANRALDDAVVELLRPMLRQWLDENMPRIVEAALRTEIADMAPGKIAGGKRN